MCLATASRLHISAIILADPYIRADGKIPAPGWNQVLTNRSAILTHKSIQATVTPSPHPDVAAVQIGNTTIIGIYAPPKGPLEEALLAAEQLAQTHNPHIIAGDLNCRTALIPGQHSNARGRLLEDFIHRNNLLLCNSPEATWSRTLQGRQITGINDYTLSSHPVHHWKILPEDSLSDHRLITFNTNGTPTTHKPTRLKTNDAELSTAIRNMDITTIPDTYTPAEIDTYVTSLTSSLQNALRNASSEASTHHPVPWWTEELTLHKKLLLKVSRLASRRRDALSAAILGAIHREIRRSYRNNITSAKERAWRAFCAQEKPWGKPYRVLRQLNDNSAQPVVPMKKPDGNFTTTLEERASLLLTSKFPQCTSADNHHLHGVPGPAPATTTDSITTVIRHLNNKSAPGPDKLTPKCVKKLHLHHPDILPSLYTQCIAQSHFPTMWKHGRVVMIPKPGRDPSLPEAYRPITLLSVLGKVLEKVIKTHIDHHIESHNILHPRQYGFRSKRSTEMAVSDVVDSVKRLQASHPLTCIISLDIHGAFDHARWDIILKSLSTQRFLHWIVAILQSYLSNRTVVYEGATLQLSRGCPQGSVLGPTMWNLAYNATLSLLQHTPNSGMICFADDSLLLIAAKSGDELEEAVAHTGTLIVDHLQSQGLELNTNKTQVLVFKQKSKRNQAALNLQIHDQKLTPQPTLKYLGMVLDDKLQWDAHISYITKRATRILPAILATSRNVFGYSNWSRRIMINSILESLYNYGSSLYYQRIFTNLNMKQIHAITRRGAICCARLYRTVSHDAALVISGTRPLEHRILERAVQWLLRNGRDVPLWGHIPPLQPIDPASRAEYSLVNNPSVTVSSRDLKNWLQETSITSWQASWSTSTHGQWTRKLIPEIRPWLASATPNATTFWSSQALSGHGCFRMYLLEKNRSNTSTCNCGHPRETAQHILEECPRFTEGRPEDGLKVTNRDHLKYMSASIRRLWAEEQARAKSKHLRCSL